MRMETCVKESFAVIGKEGATSDGSGFIQRLWAEANGHFPEVEPLAKRDKKGNLAGIWGAMSDLSRSFKPWEDNFSKGLYLAGVECDPDAEAPEGWTKWTIPAYTYLRVESENGNTFGEMLPYMEENHIPLVAAVHDFTCPTTGKNYLFFPIKAM